MISVYKKLKVVRVNFKFSFSYPYATPCSPLYMGYNPNTYTNPGSAKAIADLQSHKLLLNTQTGLHNYSFKLKNDQTILDQQGFFDVTETMSMGSLQLYAQIIGTAVNQLVGYLTSDYYVSWTSIA
jgi:hypothetical protein